MDKSGEFVIGDVNGVWKTRTVHRMPLSEGWDPKTLDLVHQPPWRTCDGGANVDGERPEGVQVATMAGRRF